MIHRAAVVSLVMLAGCSSPVKPPPAVLSSFNVEVQGLYLGAGATRTPLAVVTVCANKYGNQAMVPPAVKGTKECPYAIARGPIEIDVTATALDLKGKLADIFSGPVSFRVVPGDLSGGYASRYAIANNGKVSATIRTLHQYGTTRVWAEDAPPQPIYSDGGMVPDVDGGLPPEPSHRTYATGLSPALYFEEPTLAKVQIPDGFDNRSSPLVGEFLSIGKAPESGERLVQSCALDPQRDGQPALMVITGTDPSGFFVTDVSACRQIELTDAGSDGPKTAEPKDPCMVPLLDGGSVKLEDWDSQGGTGATPRCKVSNEICSTTNGCRSYLPGTFGHMFVYNYSFPDGLDEGDLLWTLSGSVQEFTSTTQMTFPSWSIAEKVRRLPPEQWNKWLQYAPPVEVNNRTCGSEDVVPAFLTDQLCGHNRRNLKMESLESGLVKVPRVQFPSDFAACDFNADSSVPFFCETRDPEGNWLWSSCVFPPSPPEPPADAAERICNSDCVVAAGSWAGKVCSERTTFTGFGQFVVEMNPPGAASFGYDESVPKRVQRFNAGATAAKPGVSYAAGVDVLVGCDTDAHLAFGASTVVATTADPLVSKGKVVRHSFVGTEATVSAVAAAGATAGKCWIAQNFHNRINLITKDALPELQPDCSLTDPDPAKATQCKYTRGATFDVIGHLRHLQPGRPRWAIIPRDPDDVCCHPGPGLGCPRPVKPCP